MIIPKTNYFSEGRTVMPRGLDTAYFPNGSQRPRRFYYQSDDLYYSAPILHHIRLARALEQV
jgi:hypothetical protein